MHPQAHRTRANMWGASQDLMAVQESACPPVVLLNPRLWEENYNQLPPNLRLNADGQAYIFSLARAFEYARTGNRGAVDIAFDVGLQLTREIPIQTIPTRHLPGQSFFTEFLSAVDTLLVGQYAPDQISFGTTAQYDGSTTVRVSVDQVDASYWPTDCVYVVYNGRLQPIPKSIYYGDANPQPAVMAPPGFGPQPRLAVEQPAPSRQAQRKNSKGPRSASARRNAPKPAAKPAAAPKPAAKPAAPLEPPVNRVATIPHRDRYVSQAQVETMLQSFLAGQRSASGDKGTPSDAPEAAATSAPPEKKSRTEPEADEL